MLEVLKCFAFFGAGLLLGKLYERDGWRKYKNGRADAGKKFEELPPARYTPRRR